MRRCDWVTSFSCKGAEEAAVVARHREPGVLCFLSFVWVSLLWLLAAASQLVLVRVVRVGN